MTEPADKILQGDCLEVMKSFEDNSVDLIVTDPPYGISFMGKDWDKALPPVDVWKEALRILKPGAFAFVMCSPRSDCSWRMKAALEQAGFRINFTPIFWAYASGFPKAQNIAKVIEKRHREPDSIEEVEGCGGMTSDKGYNVTKHHEIYEEYKHPDAQALAGAYGGFQPKPAVEEIIVAMKPLSEKSFPDQALTNQKGVTWLDDCKIPIARNDKSAHYGGKQFGSIGCSGNKSNEFQTLEQTGRFPANLLVSDDVLNDGMERVSGTGIKNKTGLRGEFFKGLNLSYSAPSVGGDKGSFSRYFDLDAWAKTFPFLIVPKPSKSEKNAGLEGLPEGQTSDGCERANEETARKYQALKSVGRNIHPTVKPLKLMAYLVMLGSREGDLILDPYVGSGTTSAAAILLNRQTIGIELDENHVRTAKVRCRWAEEMTQASEEGLTLEEKKQGQQSLFRRKDEP